jgi:hypothetical protein
MNARSCLPDNGPLSRPMMPVPTALTLLDDSDREMTMGADERKREHDLGATTARQTDSATRLEIPGHDQVLLTARSGAS